MDTVTDILFLTGVAFLFAHELDAIQQHEWRFFFAFNPFSDNTAYRLFTALHIPLFVLILWNLPVPGFQVGLDIILIVHGGLHWLLRNHPKVTFSNGFSRVWIFGGALVGVMHLALLQQS